ncbi:unnamed protein product [Linum tenue]|uniref:Uncharacterized protein n=1 Tax=Linum tenue TaxID=586396 RepID=A0AAV0MK97_9ROSI|nr:unnamed protein product [Linum tenue]
MKKRCSLFSRSSVPSLKRRWWFSHQHNPSSTSYLRKP